MVIFKTILSYFLWLLLGMVLIIEIFHVYWHRPEPKEIKVKAEVFLVLETGKDGIFIERQIWDLKKDKK